ARLELDRHAVRGVVHVDVRRVADGLADDAGAARRGLVVVVVLLPPARGPERLRGERLVGAARFRGLRGARGEAARGGLGVALEPRERLRAVLAAAREDVERGELDARSLR